MRISMVSEHASPLAALGGVDAGGQNVHVAALSEALAKRGHHVTVYTRRDATELPAGCAVGPGLRCAGDCGTRAPVPKDELLPFMAELAGGVGPTGPRPPDVVHGHFWMSGWPPWTRRRRGPPASRPSTPSARSSGGTRAQRTPAPRGRRRRAVRRADRVIATCSDEVFELARLGPRAAKTVVPCGVDPALFSPEGPVDPKARRHRISPWAAWCPARASTR